MKKVGGSKKSFNAHVYILWYTIAKGVKMIEESHLVCLRRMIEEQYRNNPTGCGGSFGEILCYEIHANGLTFIWLAEKWEISLPALGELIWDHCKRLEELPHVNHDYEILIAIAKRSKQ